MKKLKLNELKVKSFVTALENNESNTVKGGSNPLVVSNVTGCMNTQAHFCTGSAVDACPTGGRSCGPCTHVNCI